PGLGHPCPSGGELIGFDEVGAAAFEAEQDGVEGAGSGARGGQGSGDIDLEGGHVPERVGEGGDEGRARARRSDGGGARGSDADGEDVEDTQWHGNHFVSMTTGPTEGPCTAR